MKLIVGLGNTGKKYEKTRHNVGFDVLNVLAERSGHGASKEKFSGRLMEAIVAGERAMLLWPYTLMNRSGQAVRAAVDFYQLPLSELLIVCDDFNLPLGKLRLRSQGSSGGQNGLADIILRLATEEFARLRIGIGPVPDSWEGADFVLGRFGPAERASAEDAVARAADAVECWVARGIAEAMNNFN